MSTNYQNAILSDINKTGNLQTLDPSTVNSFNLLKIVPLFSFNLSSAASDELTLPALPSSVWHAVPSHRSSAVDVPDFVQLIQHRRTSGNVTLASCRFQAKPNAWHCLWHYAAVPRGILFSVGESFDFHGVTCSLEKCLTLCRVPVCSLVFRRLDAQKFSFHKRYNFVLAEKIQQAEVAAPV